MSAVWWIDQMLVNIGLSWAGIGQIWPEFGRPTSGNDAKVAASVKRPKPRVTIESTFREFHPASATHAKSDR